MAEHPTPKPTIDERTAAPYTGFTVAALRAWRQQGRGPAFIRVNRSIRYRISDLEDWLTAHRVTTEGRRS